MKVLMICTVELARNGIATCILNYYYTINKLGVQIDIVAASSVDKAIKNNLKKLF